MNKNIRKPDIINRKDRGTDGNRIIMNSLLDYQTNKLYFFHALTHAL